MDPKNWSRKKVSEVFDVSERLVIEARQQEKSNGVLQYLHNVEEKRYQKDHPKSF